MATRILLDESDIPTHWYEVVADMPNPPAPPLGHDFMPPGLRYLGDSALVSPLYREKLLEVQDLSRNAASAQAIIDPAPT